MNYIASKLVLVLHFSIWKFLTWIIFLNDLGVILFYKFKW